MTDPKSQIDQLVAFHRMERTSGMPKVLLAAALFAIYLLLWLQGG